MNFDETSKAVVLTGFVYSNYLLVKKALNNEEKNDRMERVYTL